MDAQEMRIRIIQMLISLSFTLFQLAAVIALPGKGVEEDPAIMRYNATSKVYDVTIDARSSDIACRWGLWPEWTKMFTSAGKPIPAFSVADNRDSRYNQVGKMIFDCADKRTRTNMVPDEEMYQRGAFSIPCGEGNVVQRFPIIDLYDEGNSNWDNLNYHRQYCAKIFHDYNVMTVLHGAGQCWFVRVSDDPHQVLTVDVTAVDNHSQLVQNYISVTEAADVHTVPPVEFRAYLSSFSTKVESSKVYHVCVNNYQQAGDPNFHPEEQDLFVHIATSIDQLQ